MQRLIFATKPYPDPITTIRQELVCCEKYLRWRCSDKLSRTRLKVGLQHFCCVRALLCCVRALLCTYFWWIVYILYTVPIKRTCYTPTNFSKFYTFTWIHLKRFWSVCLHCAHIEMHISIQRNIPIILAKNPWVGHRTTPSQSQFQFLLQFEIVFICVNVE